MRRILRLFVLRLCILPLPLFIILPDFPAAGPVSTVPPAVGPEPGLTGPPPCAQAVPAIGIVRQTATASIFNCITFPPLFARWENSGGRALFDAAPLRLATACKPRTAHSRASAAGSPRKKRGNSTEACNRRLSYVPRAWMKAAAQCRGHHE